MIQRFAQVFGAVYVLVGIAGFIPGVNQPAAPPDAYGPGGGMLLALFPVNYLHDVVHLAIGAWGLLAAASAARAVTYARVIGVAYIALGVIGLIGFAMGGRLPTDMLVPLSGNDWWLHLASGIVAAYFGWSAPVRTSSAA